MHSFRRLSYLAIAVPKLFTLYDHVDSQTAASKEGAREGGREGETGRQRDRQRERGEVIQPLERIDPTRSHICRNTRIAFYCTIALKATACRHYCYLLQILHDIEQYSLIQLCDAMMANSWLKLLRSLWETSLSLPTFIIFGIKVNGAVDLK